MFNVETDPDVTNSSRGEVELKMPAYVLVKMQRTKARQLDLAAVEQIFHIE